MEAGGAFEWANDPAPESRGLGTLKISSCAKVRSPGARFWYRSMRVSRGTAARPWNASKKPSF